MGYVVASLILMVLIFISVVNYSYQSTKYRGLPDETRRELNSFNSPAAWMIYTIIIVFILGFVLFSAFNNIVGGIISLDNSSQ